MNVRLVDMNNSGKLDLLVVCNNAGTILVYTQGNRKDKWTFREDCNGYGSLGDIVYSACNVTQDDIDSACAAERDTNYVAWRFCFDKVKNGVAEAPVQMGLTLADINNDGFEDIVAGYGHGDTSSKIFLKSWWQIKISLIGPP